MTNEWKPLHDNHAINVMGLSVTFTEPLPAVLFRKAIAVAEQSALNEGLRHKQPLLNTFQFNVQGGVPQPLQQLPSGGALFSSYFENSSLPGVAPQISEQVQIEPQTVMYRTWGYVSWTWQKERYLRLLADCLSMIEGSAGVSLIRLEYQDRFLFEGDPREASVASLLRAGSRYLSPHIFEENGMWHSHTGHFLPKDGVAQKLLQINVDALDEGFPAEIQRWINIATARENRYPASLDEIVAFELNSLATVLDSEHDELKIALAEIINDETANRIYLKG